MRPVRPTPSAELDVDRVALDYESARAGLGIRFLDDLDHVVSRIGEGPLQFPLVGSDVRRAMLHDFPYAVYFRLEADAIRIIAVSHLRRHPATLAGAALIQRTLYPGSYPRFGRNHRSASSTGTPSLRA